LPCFTIIACHIIYVIFAAAELIRYACLIRRDGAYTMRAMLLRLCQHMLSHYAATRSPLFRHTLAYAPDRAAAAMLPLTYVDAAATLSCHASAIAAVDIYA